MASPSSLKIWVSPATTRYLIVLSLILTECSVVERMRSGTSFVSATAKLDVTLSVSSVQIINASFIVVSLTFYCVIRQLG